MPSSLVRRFSDPGDYMACLKYTKAEIVVTAPGRLSSKLTQIALPGVHLNRYADNLPRVLKSHHALHRALICFSTKPGPPWFCGTSEIPFDRIVRLRDGDSSFQRSSGPIEFGAISLSVEDMEALGSAFDCTDFGPPRATLITTPRPDALARFRKIHAAAGDLAEHAPGVIASPEAARALQQSLLAALGHCLAAPASEGWEAASHHRNLIMKRFYATLEAHPDGILHTIDMCEAIGVSNRTLTTCCNETLGVSPHQYLKARQLQLVRRALVHADPHTTTVTAVATEHGFWDLGRFAAAYRARFGERPSETLGHGAEARNCQESDFASENT